MILAQVLGTVVSTRKDSALVSLKLLLTRTRGPATVFDLRQETHLFVNGLPITWFATNDWANVGRTHGAIEAGEAARVQSLKPGSEITVTGGDIKKSGAASSAPVHVTVRDAKTERELVEANNAAYVRLTVTDHARPLDEEVDRFILAVRALPENGWAHFHCEAGRGRTTTFMVLYDMLRNADPCLAQRHCAAAEAARIRLRYVAAGRGR